MKKHLLKSLFAGAGLCIFMPASAQLSPSDNPANYHHSPIAPASIIQPSANNAASVPCGTPATSDAFLCDSGSVTLNASNGTAYAWYNTPTGGTPLSLNSSYTTPTLYATASYYVEALCNPDSLMMPLPAHSGAYNGNIRGYYFTAPVNFTIHGLRVPTDVSTNAQTIEIVRFNAGAPPAYPSLTNSFTSLGYWNGVSSTAMIPTNIQVNAGDVIGIYGWRGTDNSYSSGGSYISNIAGFPVTLERTGMQYDLNTSQMHDIWSEVGGSISRTEMYYSFMGDTSIRVMSTVHVNATAHVSNPVTICSGDSIFAEGAYQTTAGTYRDTLQTVSGCDSIITTTLTVNPSYLVTSSATICSNDSVFAGGGYQNTSGVYRDTLQTAAGCDSILEVVLTVNPAYYINNSVSVCAGDSIFAGGAYQTTTGTYYDSLQTTMGCDSIIETILTVNQPAYFANPRSICAGDSIFAGGAYQTAAGSYFDTLLTVNGCDSIVETILTVNPLPTVTLAAFSNDTVCVYYAAMPLPSASPAGGTFSGNGISGTTFDPATAGNGTHTIVYTYQDNNGCTSSASTDITVIACTGINEYEGAQVEIFPNPATDAITIKVNIQDARVQLVDVTGRMIADEVMNGSTIQLDLSTLTPAKGIYMVRVISGSNIVSVKKITRM